MRTNLIAVVSLLLLAATASTTRSETSSMGDLIVVTDEGGHPQLCDRISVYTPDGGLVHRGQKTISPGRLAIGQPPLTYAAVNSNHFRGFTLVKGPQWWSGDPFRFREDAQPVYGGGIAVLEEDTVLVGLSTPENGGVEERPPFYVGRIRISDSNPTSGVGIEARAEIPAPAVEILPTKDLETARIVTSKHEVYHLSLDDMELVGNPIQLAAIVYSNRDDPEGYKWEFGRQSLHNCSFSPDQTTVVCNRWGDPSLATANVETGDTAVVSLSRDLLRSGGVAYNHSLPFNGLLAVHGGSRVQVGRLTESRFEVIAETVIEPPRISPGAGPMFSLGWSTSGRYLTAASGENSFDVFEFDGNRLVQKSKITACDSPDSQGPNDVGNPELTVPYRVFLPVVFKEECRPTRSRAEVVLVIDASSSMLELTRSGRTKLSAAQEAAKQFVSHLQDGDRAAIVAFNNEAQNLITLTDDKALLYQALDLIETGGQTRIHLGIESAYRILEDQPIAGNTRAVILLTDGRSNPEPSVLAVEAARAVRAEDITIYTIGLGNEVDLEALQEIASPGGFRQAPDGDDLTSIYEEIAREIPCGKGTRR